MHVPRIHPPDRGLETSNAVQGILVDVLKPNRLEPVFLADSYDISDLAGAEQGALRELDEELGVGGDCIELVGRLSPIYVFNSNFEVQPVVGVLEGAPLFRPNAGEVAEVIEIPVPALLQCPPQRTRWRVKTSAYFVAPTIYWKQRRVWGATLLVLGELLEVLRETLGKTVSPGIARR